MVESSTMARPKKNQAPQENAPSSPASTDVAQNQSPPKEKIGILHFVISERESIDEIHVPQVRNAISGATAQKLFLVIDSSGGNPYAAVRIMRILRKKFPEIWGVVPHQAMSAATLMVFGTNAIFMSEESQLGPLDLPMEHPTDGTSISALDVVESLTQLQATAVEFSAGLYKDLRTGAFGEKISKAKAIELSLQHSETIVLPLIEKIDPYHRQKAVRTLKIGKWFAVDLLLSAMMSGQFPRANEAASKFVTMFPDHSYSIFRDDARMCKLEVVDSDQLPLWDKFLQTTDKFLMSGRTVIDYNEIEI